jgi:hypothetical protein
MHWQPDSIPVSSSKSPANDVRIFEALSNNSSTAAAIRRWCRYRLAAAMELWREA